MKKIFVLFVALVLSLAGCGDDYDSELAARLNNENTLLDYRTEETAAQRLLEQMSLEDKLWQLFYVTPEAVSGNSSDIFVDEAFTENAAVKKVGGIILFGENIYNETQLTKLLGDLSVSFDIPLFLGADEEGGSVSRLSGSCGVTDNGNMSDIPTAQEARLVGERLGSELSALGFNMDFAPVADVLVNPENTEIGKRSFGSDASDVAQKTAAEVEGMQSMNVSSVLKHFPGHASTTANSHDGASVSYRTLEQLRSEELLPFISGIEAGADFVMISHMSLPNVIGDNTPCSLSKLIVTDLLKNELGFEGIVITDALNMGAVSTLYTSGEACVRAIEAGADMLLMPSDLDESYNALLLAVQSGQISEERINESVLRILTIKEKRNML